MESGTERELRVWIERNADDFWVPRMMRRVERPEQLAIIAVGIAFQRMLTLGDSRTCGLMLREIESFGVEGGLIRAVMRTLMEGGVEALKAQENN